MGLIRGNLDVAMFRLHRVNFRLLYVRVIPEAKLCTPTNRTLTGGPYGCY